MNQLIAIVTLLLLCASPSFGEPGAFDWPQWQGPARNAMSNETGLLGEWPEQGPTLAWRIEKLGGGYSAPAVVGGKLYGLSNRGDDEVVWCLREHDGSEVWVSRLGPCLLYTSPSPRDQRGSRMPSSA